MEVAPHLTGSNHPDVVGQLTVDRMSQSISGPPRRHFQSSRLSARVHPGIRPSRSRYPHWLVAQASKRRFEHTLHGSLRGLHLPPGEAAAIVVQDELEDASRHHRETIRAHA
jgi:hypothetical protein